MRRSRPRPALKGFPPVIDAGVERLILGSFPSDASLQAAQYYAHPRNQFWRLLGALLGEPLAELPYAKRLRVVRSHRLGIWDVLGACDRTGSADTAIRNAQANRFARLRRLAPNLVDVAFNGRTAGRFEPTFAAAGFRTTVLPSSSPAHASLKYGQKLALWQAWWSSLPRDSSPGPGFR
jgi:hypoxanthine-DNA glycosylase